MLRVTQAFADYVVGAEITDASAIEAILASDQAHFVVRVAAPIAPEPEAEAEAAPIIAAPAEPKE